MDASQNRSEKQKAIDLIAFQGFGWMIQLLKPLPDGMKELYAFVHEKDADSFAEEFLAFHGTSQKLKKLKVSFDGKILEEWNQE